MKERSRISIEGVVDFRRGVVVMERKAGVGGAGYGGTVACSMEAINRGAASFGLSRWGGVITLRATWLEKRGQGGAGFILSTGGEAMAQILRTIDEARAELKGSVVTIGNFDGMHIGHQAIFREALERARSEGVRSVALTFEPHPIAFFRPDAAPPRLAPPPYKYDVMSDYGIDLIVELEFNRELASQTPEEFVEGILHEGLSASHVVVGRDFRFGKGRAGDPEVLRELGEPLGMSSIAAEGVKWGGEVVSSTRIREAIKGGDFAAAQAMLGRPYRLYGVVEHGAARGRTLGFPTANLGVSNMALPPDGVYATTMGRRGQVHWRGVTGIGTRPTFGGGERTVETFIFDERIGEGLDLYDDEMELDFYKQLRGDKKFSSAEELIEQMERDTEGAREFFDGEGFDGG